MEKKYVRFSREVFHLPARIQPLLLSSCFYKSFSRFSHILLYQLDCLVFRDELNDWCSRTTITSARPGWIATAICGRRGHMEIGNGGFTLRKVTTAQEILTEKNSKRPSFCVPPVRLTGRESCTGWSLIIRKRIKQHLSLRRSRMSWRTMVRTRIDSGLSDVCPRPAWLQKTDAEERPVRL